MSLLHPHVLTLVLASLSTTACIAMSTHDADGAISAWLNADDAGESSAGEALTVAAAVGLGYVHPFRDPRAESAKGPGTLLQRANMPAEAKAVLVTECADCHSSGTRWPVYARIPPGSWLIERDIIEARKKMNLSQWEQMPADKQEVLTAKIFDEAKSGDMSPLQYRLLHWDARLSKANVQALSMLGRSASGSEATLAGEGDAVQGKAVFERRCTGCHAMAVDREGPRLAGVFGRKAGSVPGLHTQRD